MLRVGLLGSGFMGEVHAEAWRHAGSAKVVAIGGIPIERAERLAGIFGADATASLDEVVARRDVEAVDICLPTPMHEEFAVKALQSGKHVLCEKPLTLSLDSADRIFEAAAGSGKVFMVAQVVRFWPQYRAARDLVNAGAVGRLLSARLSRTSAPPSWAKWFEDPHKSGGALFDLGIHDLDYAVWLLGRPGRVHAVGLRSPAGGVGPRFQPPRLRPGQRRARGRLHDAAMLPFHHAPAPARRRGDAGVRLPRGRQRRIA